MTPIVDHPIRIPIEVQHFGTRWLYLRKWTKYHSWAERTWANLSCNVVAHPDSGYIRFPLLRVDCLINPNHHDPYHAEALLTIMGEVDRYLLQVGGEPVFDSDEWPEGCVGEAKSIRPDRLPWDYHCITRSRKE